MKYLVILFVVAIVSCTNPIESDSAFEPDISIEANLEKDGNGYYHMYVERSNMQTLHRISLNTNFENSIRVEWDANSHWIGTHFGFEFEIPVINGVSYTSTDDGSAQTMFAPVVELVGDTVTVTATSEDVVDTINIILE